MGRPVSSYVSLQRLLGTKNDDLYYSYDNELPLLSLYSNNLIIKVQAHYLKDKLTQYNNHLVVDNDPGAYVLTTSAPINYAHPYNTTSYKDLMNLNTIVYNGMKEGGYKNKLVIDVNTQNTVELKPLRLTDNDSMSSVNKVISQHIEKLYLWKPITIGDKVYDKDRSHDILMCVEIPIKGDNLPIHPDILDEDTTSFVGKNNSFYNHELKYTGIKRGGKLILENRVNPSSAQKLLDIDAPNYPYFETYGIGTMQYSGDIVDFNPYHIHDDKHFIVHNDVVSPGKSPLEFVEIRDLTARKVYLISTKCVARNTNYFDVALGYVHYEHGSINNSIVIDGDTYKPIFMTVDMWETIVLNLANIEGLPVYHKDPNDNGLTVEDFNNDHNKIWNWAGVYTMATDTPNGVYGEHIYTLGNYYANFKRDLSSTLENPSYAQNYYYDNLAFRPVLVRDLTDDDYAPKINGNKNTTIHMGEILDTKDNTGGVPYNVTLNVPVESQEVYWEYPSEGVRVDVKPLKATTTPISTQIWLPIDILLFSKPNELNTCTFNIVNKYGKASALVYFTPKFTPYLIDNKRGTTPKANREYIKDFGEIYDDIHLVNVLGKYTILNSSTSPMVIPEAFRITQRIQGINFLDTFQFTNKTGQDLSTLNDNRLQEIPFNNYADNPEMTILELNSICKREDLLKYIKTLPNVVNNTFNNELIITPRHYAGNPTRYGPSNRVSNRFKLVNPINIVIENDTITSLRTNTIDYQLTTKKTTGETVYVTESLNGKTIRENFEVQMTSNVSPTRMTLTIPQEDFNALKPNSQHTISIVVKRQLNGAPTTYELDTVKQDIIFNKDLNPPTVDISSINNLTFSFTCKPGVGETNQNITKVDIVLRNKILKTFGQSEVSSTMTYTVSRDNLEAGDNEILIKVYTDSNIQGDARINAKYTPIKNILNNDIIIIGNTPYVVRGVENFADTHTIILDKPTTVKTGQHLDVLGKGVNVKVKSNEVEYPLTLITSSKLLDGKIEDKYTSDLPNVENVTLVLNINEDLTIHQLQEAFNYKEGSEV